MMNQKIESRQRLLSGIQPTGQMHLGNYLGAVVNWVELQHQFESFFFIADYHALTTLYENPAQLRTCKFELAIDLLAAGLDPDKCCLFYQSDVPAHAELHLLLSMITPLPWLERVPTYKEKISEINDKDLDTYGFLGYPLLQAADIIIYKAGVVPVGKDQLPHLELTREVARRFNHLYGNVFPEPMERMTLIPTLPGTDGRKMSKSYGNIIPLSSSEDDMRKLVMGMFTDPERKRRQDPGTPEKCPVYNYQQIINRADRVAEIAGLCRTAGIGCVDCKKECAQTMLDYFAAFRERRARFLQSPDLVRDILAAGAKRAGDVAGQTMAEVKTAIGLH